MSPTGCSPGGTAAERTDPSGPIRFTRYSGSAGPSTIASRVRTQRRAFAVGERPDLALQVHLVEDPAGAVDAHDARGRERVRGAVAVVGRDGDELPGREHGTAHVPAVGSSVTGRASAASPTGGSTDSGMPSTTVTGRPPPAGRFAMVTGSSPERATSVTAVARNATTQTAAPAVVGAAAGA